MTAPITKRDREATFAAAFPPGTERLATPPQRRWLAENGWTGGWLSCERLERQAQAIADARAEERAICAKIAAAYDDRAGPHITHREDYEGLVFDIHVGHKVYADAPYSDSRPTEAGTYWLRRGFDGPLAVLVRDGLVGGQPGLWVDHPQLGRSRPIASTFFDGAEWCKAVAP